MSLAAARIAMQAIASYSTDENARHLAQDALEELDRADDPAPTPPAAGTRPLTSAERARRYRASKRHGDRHETRDGPSRRVTKTVTPAVTIVTENVTVRDASRDASCSRDLDLDLSVSESFQDFLGDLLLGGPEGTVTETVTDRHETPSRSVTKRVTAVTASVTRKKPKTHCPGPEESTEAIDGWCRSHRIPPASQVPEVDAMIGWHQKNGVPRASWLRTWQDWQKKSLQLAREAPSGVHLVADETSGPEARRRAEAAVRAAYRASPEYQADLARAREAEQVQERKARAASQRGRTEPTPLAGRRPKPAPTERELAEREHQIDTLIEDEIRKAGGT